MPFFHFMIYTKKRIYSVHDGSIRKEDPKETEREVDQLNTKSYRKQNVHLQDDDSVDFRMGMGGGGG